MKVKILKNGCAIFPNSSVIEVEGLIKPVKTVQNEVNGNNYLPKDTLFEEFSGETTHFCTNCGKEFHRPKNWEYVMMKMNFIRTTEAIAPYNRGTCKSCCNKLTKC